MWIGVLVTNRDYHQYLFDLKARKILGELVNAEEVFFNGDQTKVLCYGRMKAQTNAIWKMVAEILKQTRLPLDFAIHSGEEPETFWVLDMKKNSATRIGKIYQWQGSGSDFKPSPDFRFGFNKPTGSLTLPEFFVCDMENDTLRKHHLDGHPCGWWDNKRILMKDSNYDLILYDVVSQKTSPLVTQQQLRTFYAANGLTNIPASINPFFQWNGKENDFFLTDHDDRWLAVQSFLVKIEKPDGRLKMIDPHFKFEWSDHFDATDSHYLYSGRESGWTNSAVYLRDVKTGQTRELVPPDLVQTNQFSIPQFYKDEVIYHRSNAFWTIGQDGKNNRRLFPPAE